jgi:hypothetical protein
VQFFFQSLDYEGIPFKCGLFNVCGNLVKECLLPNRRKIWYSKDHIEGGGNFETPLKKVQDANGLPSHPKMPRKFL